MQLFGPALVLCLYITCHNPSPPPPHPSLSSPFFPPAVDPPRITTQPQDRLNVIPDSVARFTVTASGLRLNYTWMQDGGALPNGGRFVTASEMLTIQNVNVSDAGSYSCVVSNAAGNDTSNSARLTLGELCICFVRDTLAWK